MDYLYDICKFSILYSIVILYAFIYTFYENVPVFKWLYTTFMCTIKLLYTIYSLKIKQFLPNDFYLEY